MGLRAKQIPKRDRGWVTMMVRQLAGTGHTDARIADLIGISDRQARQIRCDNEIPAGSAVVRAGKMAD
jgi:hypothetical protein